MNTRFENELWAIVEPYILRNDKAHDVGHVKGVLANCRLINDTLELNISDNLLVSVAFIHDIGCCQDRDTHHVIARDWTLNNLNLGPLTELNMDEINLVANAVLRHRSSYDVSNINLTVLDQVIRAADRGNCSTKDIVYRAYKYSRSKLGMINPNEALDRAYGHIAEKYGIMQMEPLWESTWGKFRNDEFLDLPITKPFCHHDFELRYKAEHV